VIGSGGTWEREDWWGSRQAAVFVKMLVILKLRFNRIDPQLSGVAARFFIYICVYHIT
jgi:hypothetical protein